MNLKNTAKPPLLVHVALWTALLVWPAQEARAENPTTHVLLINGGGEARSNYQSHLHHLQDMMKVLKDRGIPSSSISVFSADGENPAKDLATRDLLPNHKDLWLLQGTQTGQRLLPKKEYKNSVWDGVKMHPATLPKLRAWFKKTRSRMKPGDNLLIFVTDHGTRGKDDLDNGNIVLWKDSLSVLEFRGMLGQIKPDNRVVMIMSQCFSGTFAQSMYKLGEPLPHGNTCGFFATQNDRFAYGCYPEGRGKDKIGHAFKMIDALRTHKSVNAAHEEVMLSDDAPDVPLRTSDVFLKDLVARDAASKGVPLMERAHQLLSNQTLSDADAKLLQKLAAATGLEAPTSPLDAERTLEKIVALRKSAEKTSKLWQGNYKQLKQINLKRFFAEDPDGKGWKKRTSASSVKKLSPEERATLLEELLQALREHTRAHKETWDGLRRVREKKNSSAAVRYRMQKREAALLKSRNRYLRRAGELLLEPDTTSHLSSLEKRAAQASLGSLIACEAFAPGEAPEPPKTLSLPTLPPLRHDQATLEDTRPSWLGVAYKVLSSKEASRQGVGAGAVLVQKVVPGSPAENAGLQKGDILLRGAETTFSPESPLKAWVMSSPQGKPLPLNIMRQGQEKRVELSLIPYPLAQKAPLRTPGEGEIAPPLQGIKTLGDADMPSLRGQEHLILFWHSACEICKAAVPELLEQSRKRGIPLVLINADKAEKQKAFWSALSKPPEFAIKSADLFARYGIKRSPTLFHIGVTGMIRHRTRRVGDLSFLP